MRKTALLSVLLLASVVFAQEGAPSRITFNVRNDVNEPVTNATVGGCFPNLTDPGHGGFNGVTDTNGVFICEGEAVIGVYARFTKSGYYSTTVEQNLDPRVKLKWQKGWQQDRWETEIPILLKPMRKPIAMNARNVENIRLHKNSKDRLGRYVLESTVGYDMVKGEIVATNGKGSVADMQFTRRMRIYSKDGDGLAVDYDSLCEIRMTNTVDGICLGKPDGTEDGQYGSLYISAYEAPVEGYTSAISLYRNVRGTKAESNDDKHFLYYFRIRTQTNEMGQVTNALYGKIYGQINGSFSYFLNPTPNDRNVEFDPKKNLFTTLGEFEQVHRP